MPTLAILEDDERRREAMLHHLAADALEVHVFPRAPDMVAWLEANLDTCALISLDHDLVSPTPGDDPGTGMDVASFLGQREPRCPVIVHTSNHLAAPGMRWVLSQARWANERVAPFNDLEWVEVSWAPTVRAILAGTHRFEDP